LPTRALDKLRPARVLTFSGHANSPESHM